MAHGPATLRTLSAIVLALALAACGGVTHSAAPSASALRADLSGSPPPLAALHRQANRLLPADTAALRARLRTLRGYPVVVMVWASWCPPCQADFPYFQRLSATLGRRVAFVGVDVSDSPAKARAFLRRLPVSFPSYRDPHRALAAVPLGTAYAHWTPATYFFPRGGGRPEAYLGPFLGERSLRTKIRRYLGV